MPGCRRVIEHGNYSQNAYFKPKDKIDDLTIIGKVKGGDEIEVVEDQGNSGALWHIELNPLLPEPLITIYVNNKPLIILDDMGSEVNCVSHRLVEHLGLSGKIRSTISKWFGPNGSPIETNGEIYLEFYLGNQKYNTKFIVLHLARNFRVSIYES